MSAEKPADHSSDKLEAGEPRELRNADGSSIQAGEDILALEDTDPALNMKMHLVNNVRRSRCVPCALAQS
jgi:hypothetical protein